MSHETARIAADRHDGVAPDHYPVCTGCGNLCGVLAQICVDCGTRLKPTEEELRAIGRRERIRAMKAALPREDEQATRERGD